MVELVDFGIQCYGSLARVFVSSERGGSIEEFRDFASVVHP